MRKLLLITIIFLSSCTTFNASSNTIYSNIGSENWQFNVKSSQVFADEKSLNEMYVRIDFSRAVFSNGSSGLSKNECSIRQPSKAYVVILRFGNYKGADARNDYKLDLNKVYLVKNNNSYNLAKNSTYTNKTSNVADLTHVFNKSPYTKKPFYSNPNYPFGGNVFTFDIPLICGELENAILVIDGITANGKPLPPIKIRINYTNPSQVPLYKNQTEDDK